MNSKMNSVSLHTPCAWPVVTGVILSLARKQITVCAVAVAMNLSWVDASHALKPDADEPARLKQCERSVCEIILKRKTTAKMLKCDLQKTWGSDKIKAGAGKQNITWAAEDARCNLKLNVKQEQIVLALTQPAYRIVVPRHQVVCTVENNGKTSPLTFTASPRINFKNGKAVKVKLVIKNIKGPSALTSTIWTVAKMEKNFGLFRSGILKSVNKFVHQKCARKYPDLKP